MAPTQQEVAQKLGVSRQWVSRALNGDPRISASSRARVEAAARELGYLPQANPEARALASKRYGRRALTHTLGCLRMDDSNVPYWTRLVNAIQETALRHGQEVLLLHDQPSAGWDRVDGIIGHSELAPRCRSQLPVEVPFVGIFSAIHGISSIEIEDAVGAELATRHLIDLGHTRIGYLLDASENNLTIQHRLGGYRLALRESKINPRPEWEYVLWDWGEFVRRGRLSMKQWLQDGFLKTGITALVVQNDRAAIGAIQILQEAGLHVPRDISVIGFDSTDECELSSPRLTSMRVPLADIGTAAVEMLLRQINEDIDAPQTKVFPVQLEIRDSTASPRAGK